MNLNSFLFTNNEKEPFSVAEPKLLSNPCLPFVVFPTKTSAVKSPFGEVVWFEFIVAFVLPQVTLLKSSE